MREDTVLKLNQINKDFYKSVAAEFDSSRQYSWEGWDQLKKLPDGRALKEFKTVLDVGCGNARFYDFLISNGWVGDYVGIDNSTQLLELAQKRQFDLTEEEKAQLNLIEEKEVELNLSKATNRSITLQKYDILDLLKQPSTAQDFLNPFQNQSQDGVNLIISFGVLHHIPGAKNRQIFLKRLSELLAVDGLLVIAAWRFAEDSKYRERFTSWESIGLNKEDVEEGDYLLDWRRGESAIRYCHYCSDVELNNMVLSSGLKLLSSYSADGPNRVMNRYLVLKKSNILE